MNSKLLKMILSVVVVVFIIAGYLYLTEKIKINNTTEEITETAQETEMAETSDWKTYKNKEYGFSLEFPNGWKGYEITINKPKHQSDICFSVKEKGDLPFCLFQIIVYTKEQWDIFKEKSPQTVQDNENNKYFFRYSYTKNIAKTKDCENQELSKFQCDRSREVPQILSTFKFTE